MFSRTDMIWIVPERLAVLGDQRDPARDPPRDVLRASSGSPSRKKRPVACGCCAMMHLEELGPPGAHQPVDADDLARAERQRHLVDRPPAARAAAG